MSHSSIFYDDFVDVQRIDNGVWNDKIHDK